MSTIALRSHGLRVLFVSSRLASALHATFVITMQDELIDISDELAAVTGGAGRRRSSNPLGFLDGPYKRLIYGFASHKGGSMLAEKMYGDHTSFADKARGQAELKKFLVEGGKLPKGVPNLFGG
jgi:hypothetical protein